MYFMTNKRGGEFMERWYVNKDGQKKGPYTEAELETLFRKHQINELTEVQKEGESDWQPLQESSLKSHLKQHRNGVLSSIDHLTGEEEHANLKVGDLFRDVFKKHKKGEANKIFIVGTESTTPSENMISASWPKPWVYSRVFIILAITYGLLLACTYIFGNANTIPGLMVIGSFTVPFSALVFFFETNAPRNISIFDVVKMFFIGGVAALVATLILYSIIPVGKLNYFNALLVGIIEETGKMVIVALFIKSLRSKYVLNGLLIGAAVGAGFAAFESLGYAFNYSLEAFALTKNVTFASDTMLEIIFSRGWQSIGGHVAWAAITGAAIVLAKKGSENLEMQHLFTGQFWKLFIIPIVLHFLWDCPLNPLPQIAFKQIVLIIVAWVVILTLMSTGLRQVSRLGKEPKTTRSA